LNIVSSPHKNISSLDPYVNSLDLFFISSAVGGFGLSSYYHSTSLSSFAFSCISFLSTFSIISFGISLSSITSFASISSYPSWLSFLNCSACHLSNCFGLSGLGHCY
jgi:hypothetical protein